MSDGRTLFKVITKAVVRSQRRLIGMLKPSSKDTSKGRQINSDDWFRELFGFQESSCARDPARVRSKFNFDSKTGDLRSLSNDQTFNAGFFSTPSLTELREAARKIGLLRANGKARATLNGRDKLQIRHVATKDVFELHAQKEFEGATFMAASQFNCLEFPGPSVVPEDGINDYVYDGTQGPACALAAPAGTVVRNYFAPTNGSVGQTEENQINNLEDLLISLRHPDNSIAPATKLLQVRNGYTASTNESLENLNRAIGDAVAKLGRDKLLGNVRVGRHSGVEVPWAPSRFLLLPPEQRQKVTQVYCSAIACGYSHCSTDLWAPISRMVLDASYEATLWVAALEAAAAHIHINSDGASGVNDRELPAGIGRVVLTFLGGGVFQNEPEWIYGAIARACVELQDVGLEVIITHHCGVSARVAAEIERAVEDYRRARRKRTAPAATTEP